jgi:hypothetical protein
VERKMDGKTNKCVVDGQVAVLYSTGYGAGWYTWNREYGEELLFDPGIVDLVLTLRWDELATYLGLKYPLAYFGGIRALDVRWLPEGTRFRVDENDGSETIIVDDEDDWITA